MLAALFPSSPLSKTTYDLLMQTAVQGRVCWGPRLNADGLCRLQPLVGDPPPEEALPAFLPVKKILLPHRGLLWTLVGGGKAQDQEEKRAVFGLPLCDLQAAWYLDRVFADDAPYRARRADLLLVGAPCAPGPGCRCDGALMPTAGDLFVSRERGWALSPAGRELLEECCGAAVEELPLPWPESGARSRVDPARLEGADAAAWAEEAQRCLACGACSAVCPTCYCFDILDRVDAGGDVARERVWDNCFFAEHGRVAGGHDFRPGRGERLRFRMLHKRLGFGELHGQDACVGCGRCLDVCPVDIDPDQVVARLAGEVTP